MTESIIGIIVSCVIAFTVVYAATPPLIKYLHKYNSTVPDVHKLGTPMIARPAGPTILAGILASEAVLYMFFPSVSILTIMITSSLAFVIGFIDDKKVMNGWFKPLALAGAAIPIILLGAYDADLTFPLFGDIHIPIFYLAVIVLMIIFIGNTINSIDILNGASSGFMLIASTSLTICLVIVENYDIAIASLPLIFVCIAFYKYHKNPSQIFPGDSGALTFGAMYGTLAIVGGVEVLAAIALLPAIINSFFFLSSVKRIIEHNQIKPLNPVIKTTDFKFISRKDPNLPITLFRLIVAKTALTEKQAVSVIFKLAIFSGILAIGTALTDMIF